MSENSEDLSWEKWKLKGKRTAKQDMADTECYSTPNEHFKIEPQ